MKIVLKTLVGIISKQSFILFIFLLQIGEILKDKFDSAHEVHQKKKRGRRMLLPRFERFKPHTDTDLVYLKSSPDYCEFDVKRGSLGTHGRECDHVSLIFLYIIKFQLLSTFL